MIGEKNHIDSAKQAMPNIISQRRSMRLARMASTGIARTWNRPVENTARPICSALKPRTLADADAICEAVQRPSMRFVPVKSAEQQAVILLHRTRQLLIRQCSSLVSAIRAHSPSSASPSAGACATSTAYWPCCRRQGRSA